MGVGRILGLLVSWLPIPLFSITLIVSDFDGTLVENSRYRKGTWQRPYILYPIHNTHQKPLLFHTLPTETIEVSHHDLERIASDLSADGQTPGNGVGPTITLESGQKLENPGLYWLDPTPGRSFTYYEDLTDDDEKRNNLTKLHKRAVKEAESSGGTFEGLYLEYLKQITNSPEFNDHIYLKILTASNHTDNNWKNLLGHWYKTNLIGAVPLPMGQNDNALASKIALSTTSEDADFLTLERSSPQRKAKILAKMIEEIGNMALTDEDYRIAPNGKEMGQYHSIIFIDNEASNLEPVTALFKTHARGKASPIKFSLFSADLDSRVHPKLQPRFTVFDDFGFPREATEWERYAEASIMEHLKPKTKFPDEIRCDLIIANQGVRMTGGAH